MIQTKVDYFILKKAPLVKALGYYYRIALPRNIQAATEDCLLFNKQLYLNLEGINESLGKEWMGVDLSLQFASAGKRNVYMCPMQF